MCHVTNAEMRKRIIFIAAAYIRMRETAGLPANRISVKILTKQYGFVNFTRIGLLSTELEKMIVRRARIRREGGIPGVSESCNAIFQALGV